MLEFIPQTQIQASSINGSQGPNLGGLDLMTSIQFLLVKDYDNQLQSMANQMKGMTKIKEMIRKDIEQINLFLQRPVGTKDKKKDTVQLNDDELKFINTDKEYFYNTSTNEVDLHPPSTRTGKDAITPATTGTKTIIEKVYDAKKHKYVDKKKTVPDGTNFVKKNELETRIEQLNLKLTSLNEQSEMMSLQLQSLTNQRKIAFETISNVINKQDETLSTITRNIKG